MRPAPPDPELLRKISGAPRRRAILAKFGTQPICYMFLDPERYARSPGSYILVDDQAEIDFVRASWVPSWRDTECDIAPADGRVCVIGSLV